jgi:hypothetical protein
MLDWEGQIAEPAQRPCILLENVSKDTAMAASLCISSVESQMIDNIFQSCQTIGSYDASKPIPQHELNDDRHLQDIDPSLISSTMASNLNEPAHLSKFCASIGATTAHMDDMLFPDLVDNDVNFIGQLDLDDYMLSSANVTHTCGVTAEHLTKI